jgi:hypothetical protein
LYTLGDYRSENKLSGKNQDLFDPDQNIALQHMTDWDSQRENIWRNNSELHIYNYLSANQPAYTGCCGCDFHCYYRRF